MNSLLQDLRYAIRILIKQPSFTIVAVLALTLAIGATTTVFSVLDATVFGPLALPESGRVYGLDIRPYAGMQIPGPLIAEYEAWRDRKEAFQAVSPMRSLNMQLSLETGPELLQGALVASDFFEVAGVRPNVGRAFLPEEDQPGGRSVIVLGYGVWQRLFGGDMSILGRSINLKDSFSPTDSVQTYTVVGVMPEGFRFPAVEPEILAPLKQDLTMLAKVQPMRIFGRLRSGVDAEAGARSLARIEADLMQQSKDLYEGRVPTLTPLRQYVTGATTRLPIILMAAVMFVLLIAVSNVANLMLGQASERAQEIAVRFSVGASRWRVIRQLLTESLLLAIVSGALGLLCVGLLTGTVSALLPEDVPRIHPIHIDWRVATFAATVSVLSGALFGLYPAFNASRQSFSESLKQGKQIRLGDLSGRSVRAALTIAEVALAMILCVGAGLLSKSFLAYLRVDVGVNPKNAVMLQIPGPVAEWKDSIETRMARYRNLIDSVASVPGVGEAAMSSNVPMIMRAAAFGNRVSIDEHPISPGKLAHIQMFLITPRYFSIMGSPILHGRAFTDSDNTAGPPVAIIAEATARQFWPGRDPIGKSMTTKNGLAARTYTVVGVVRDVKKTEYEENITKTFGVDGVVYLPLFGEPGAPPPPSRFLIFRSAVDPHAVLADVRQAVLRADSKQAIRQIDFFNDVLEKDLGAPRFRAFLVGSFAGIALLIAVIGIYGVVSHTVASRLHEMGVRMVMGARGSDILRLVVGQGILLVLTGILLGIAGSFALTRLIESFLFRTEAFDGATFTAVSLIFALVALIACVLPARRAANADPISVLRCE